MGSSKDKPATDGDGGGYTSKEDKVTSAGFAIPNACAGNAEAGIFFPTRRGSNAKATTTDRIAHARLAEVHSERPEVYRFSVVEAHVVSEFIQAREAVLHIVRRLEHL
jgi:hypothetical protein